MELTRKTIQERTKEFMNRFQDWRMEYIKPAEGEVLDILDAYTRVRALALQMIDYCDSCASVPVSAFEEDEKGDFHFTKVPEAVKWLDIIADSCYGCSLLLEMAIRHDATNAAQCYNAVAAMSELIAADFDALLES